jgi:hypothetical protein
MAGSSPTVNVCVLNVPVFHPCPTPSSNEVLVIWRRQPRRHSQTRADSDACLGARRSSVQPAVPHLPLRRFPGDKWELGLACECGCDEPLMVTIIPKRIHGWDRGASRVMRIARLKTCVACRSYNSASHSRSLELTGALTSPRRAGHSAMVSARATSCLPLSNDVSENSWHCFRASLRPLRCAHTVGNGPALQNRCGAHRTLELTIDELALAARYARARG